MISYKPLMITLAKKGMKKTDLQNRLNLSSRTIAKFSYGHPIALSLLERICNELECRIEDIVEFVPDEQE